MKISASIELIWGLAVGEAIAGEFGEIKPEHFCIGLLKFSELTEKHANSLIGEGEPARVFMVEVQSLRDALKSYSVDTTRMRRSLRASLGKGGIQNKDEKIHRSPESRGLFELAAQFAEIAGSELLTAQHLFAAIVKSPAPAIVQAFGGVDVLAAPHVDTPVLNKYGKNLIKNIANGGLPFSSERAAECKAILQVLERKKKIFLVAKTKEVTDSTLTALAKFLHTEGRSIPIADQIRLIEISWPPPGDEEVQPETLHQIFDEMFDEAARCSNVLLVCSSSAMCTDKDLCGVKESAHASRLAKIQARCIVPIKAQEFEALVKADRTWKQLAESIWLNEQETKSIPREL